MPEQELRVRLTAEETRFVAAMNRAEAAFNGLTRQAERADRRMAANFDRMNRGVRVVGDLTRGLSLLGIAFGVIGTKSIKAAADFDLSMRRVEARAKATQGQISLLRDTAIDLGRRTEFTSAQVADSMARMAGAGLKFNQILNRTPIVLNLATAAEMTMADASTRLTQVMAQFKLGADDAAKAADRLAAVSANSPAILRELGQAFSFVGGHAHAAGLSLDETAAALGAISFGGMNATRAGRGLSRALSELMGATDSERRRMDELGLSFFTAAGKIKPLLEVVRELTPYLNQPAVFFELFEQVGGRAMLILTQQVSKFEDLIRVAQGANGALSTMAEIMRGGLWGDMKKFVSVIQESYRGIGEKLEPAFRSFVKALVAMPKPVQELAVAFGTLAGVLAGATFFMGITRMQSLVTAIKAIKNLPPWLVALATGHPVGAAAVGGVAIGAAAYAERGELAGMYERLGVGPGGTQMPMEFRVGGGGGRPRGPQRTGDIELFRPTRVAGVRGFPHFLPEPYSMSEPMPFRPLAPFMLDYLRRQEMSWSDPLHRRPVPPFPLDYARAADPAQFVGPPVPADLATRGRGGFAGVDWAGSFSQAFQGGGGIMGATQSIFAQGLFGEGGALAGATDKMGGVAGGAFAAGMIAAIGFGLQKITELIDDWWKKEERLVNDMRDAWKDMTNDVLEGTLSVETAARTAGIALRHGREAGDEARQHALYMEDLADAFEAVGLSAQDALRWEEKRIKETNPAVLEGLYAQLAVIGRLQKAQDELAEAISRTEQAADDWGISMEEIGLDFFSAQAVSDMALLAEQFSLLQNTGMTALQIISGAGDEVIDRLYNIGQAAVRFGLSVPAALRPAYLALLNEGRITQRQFDSMSFDTAENNMVNSINTLVTEIGNLIDAINEAFRPRFTQNAIVNDVTTRYRTVDPETGQTTWHGNTIRFGDVGGFNLDPISIPEVVTDADGNVVSVAGTPTGLGGTQTQVGPARPNPWGDPRRTGTGGGGGRSAAESAAEQARREAEQARRFALQYRLNAIRAYLGRLRDEKTEKERLLSTNEDLLEQYHDLSRAMSLGDLSFSQFDAYLSRMQELGRLTEKAAKGMRDMARSALYDPSEADSAAGRLGIQMTGDTYRKHATARELDQLLRDYQAVAQGGNTPAQIQTMFERQHTGWLASIAASVNQDGMTLAEAHEQHGRESTLLRIKRLLQDAAGFGLQLPREFMPLVKGLRGGGSVMGQGALAGLRSLVGGRAYAPLMGLGQVRKPQWSVGGGAYGGGAGGAWTEQTLFDQLTGGLQQALQENIKDPLTEQISNLTSAIAGLAGAIAHFERQERAVERELNTPPDQRAREDALKQWAKSTFGVDLYKGEVANLLGGVSMYYGTMRGILGGWGNTPRAGASMTLEQFDRMYPRASSRTGTLGFDHARHGYGAAAGQPSNPVHFRAAGGPLGLGWNVVGEIGPEAIHYQRGRAPMVYSASRTRSGGGGQPIVIRNVIELDGRVVAENQRKHLPDVLAEHGDAA